MAVFRIAYGCVLLAEATRIFYFRHLIYDAIPYLDTSTGGLPVWIFALWGVTLCSLIVGYQTFVAKMSNYVIGLLTFSSFTEFEYHAFYIYTHFNFMLLFLPVSKSLSIDARLKNSPSNPQTTHTQVSILYYYIPTFTGLGMLYLDSIVYKVSGNMWLDGLGFWLPSSLPMIVYQDWSMILNQYYLSLGLGYGILIFEFVFIFLIWHKRLRWVLWSVGVFLHLGILWVYPIPLFSLVMLSIYSLVLPPEIWNRLENIRQKSPQNHQIPQENTGVRVFNLKLSRGILFGCWIMYCGLAQVFWLYEKGISSRYAQKLNLDDWMEVFHQPIQQFNHFNQFFLGIRTHAMFVEGHFKDYNHIISLTYQDNQEEIWLPLTNPQGQATGINNGFVWVNWTFQVNSPQINRQQLTQGIQKYTAFWAYKHKVALDQATFFIKIKEIASPQGWEKDFLKKQMQKPWRNIGIVQWKDQVCQISLHEALGE